MTYEEMTIKNIDNATMISKLNNIGVINSTINCEVNVGIILSSILKDGYNDLTQQQKENIINLYNLINL